jgi:alkanesulfonate monooxygenase SsuD/methylene tetrahydromethanopterin reductase-like flavin-dependent oxidoreductase (luciferase family)
MRFGLSLPLTADIQKLITLTRFAEQVGFDTVWMPDHLYSINGETPLEAWSVLSILALQTSRVGLGTGVTSVFKYNPVVLQQKVDTLNKISSGRAFLSLGTGEMADNKLLGVNVEKPLSYLREYTSRFKNRIRTYIGALSPKMRDLAGEIADGWVPYVHTLKQFNSYKKEVEAKVGNRPFDYVANIPVSFTASEQILRSIGYRYLWSQKSNLITDEAVAKISHEELQSVSAIGRLDEVRSVLKAYIDSGATHLLIRLYDEDFIKFKEVMSTIRREI